MTDQGIRRRPIEQIWVELMKLYAVPFATRDGNWYAVTTYHLRQLAVIDTAVMIPAAFHASRR